jgi:hypothetical protein
MKASAGQEQRCRRGHAADPFGPRCQSITGNFGMNVYEESPPIDRRTDFVHIHPTCSGSATPYDA